MKTQNGNGRHYKLFRRYTEGFNKKYGTINLYRVYFNKYKRKTCCKILFCTNGRFVKVEKKGQEGQQVLEKDEQMNYSK